MISIISIKTMKALLILKVVQLFIFREKIMFKNIFQNIKHVLLDKRFFMKYSILLMTVSRLKIQNTIVFNILVSKILKNSAHKLRF